MSGVLFRRIGGRIIPIIKKSAIGTAVRSVGSSVKTGAAINKSKAGLKTIFQKRAAIPALKKQYQGLRYSSLLDVDDAKLVYGMRKTEAKISSLSKRKTTINKIGVKAASKAGAQVVGTGAAVGVAFFGSKKVKRK